TNWRQNDFLKPLQTGPKEWTGLVLSVDNFGNIVTNFGWSDFSDVARRRFLFRIGKVHTSVFSDIYDDAAAGSPFLIRGSGDYLELSVRKGDAAATAGLEPDGFPQLEWL